MWSTPSLFPTTEGPAVADFARTFLHASTGVRAGSALELVAWQAWLIDQLYERRADGLLRYRRSLVGMPRKQGKSMLGSLIALYALIEGEDGAKEVYSAAGDRQQARIVFGEAKRQINASPALNGICKVYRDVIEVPATGSIYRVLSSDAKLAQGYNPSCVVFDELHVQPNSDLWDALTLGSGARRDPQIVAITTAGHDLNTICGQMYQYGQRVCDGTLDDDAFGFFWWEAPKDCDLVNESAWREANPNLDEGLLSLDDMKVSVKQTNEIAFRRYRLNQWVRASESFLPAGAWDKCRNKDLDIDPDMPIFLGIDMALKHDSIAVVWVQQQDDVLVARSKIWFPEGDAIDVQAVENFIRELHNAYRIDVAAFDPAYFLRSAQVLADDGVPMVEFPQSAARMVPASGTLFEEIVNGRIAHSGDSTFSDQVLSATPRATDTGWRLSKGRSKRKIDAAIALAMAVDVALKRREPEIVPGFYSW